jgi:hypothetical protein
MACGGLVGTKRLIPTTRLGVLYMTCRSEAKPRWTISQQGE